MTDYQTYLDKLKCFQVYFFKYLDYENNVEENFQNLITFIKNQEIPKDENEFRLILYFINIISNNHYRCNRFFSKIEKLLLIYKKEFQDYFKNDEIFHIFKNNGRILLFLLNHNIIQMNQEISNIIVKENIYINYLFQEISPFIKDDLKKKIEEENKNIIDFELNRQKGASEQKICEIIQNDDIDGFIQIFESNNSQTNLSLETTIKRSIFETNLFLNSQKSNIALIEYSAFYGSIKIFRYLYKNDVELTPSLWLFSIHGRNPEIFSILIENNIIPKDQSYKKCLIEAIKCHHNEIVDYIINNFNQLDKNDQFISSISIEFYNFNFIHYDIIPNENIFYKFCKYDYYFFVYQLLKNQKIDINFQTNDTINNNSYIFTPLNISIFKNNTNIALLLLEYPNTDPNIEMIRKKWKKSDISMNSLALSIKMNNIKVIKQLLIHKNINVNQFIYKTKYIEYITSITQTFPPLILAIKNKQIEIVELLLSHKDINVNSLVNLTGAYLDFIKDCALALAINSNCIEIVKLLLSHDNIDVNFLSKSKIGDSELINPPLNNAIDINNIEIVKLLLSHPKTNVNNYSYKISNVQYKKRSLLEFAIKKKNIEIVKLFLSHPKINVNFLSYDKSNNNEILKSVLHYTIINNNIEILEILLSHKSIDPNLHMDKKIGNIHEKIPPLFLAAKERKIKVFKLLIGHKNIRINDPYISEDCSSYTEKSVLYFAVENNIKEIVEVLSLCSDIDINYKYSYKSNFLVKRKSLLHIAIKKCYIDIIGILINNDKIDINALSYCKLNQSNSLIEKEKSTLFYAIKYGNIKILQLLLLKKEINFNITFKKLVCNQNSFFIDKNSAIQYAILQNKIDIFECLFKHLTKNKIISKDSIKELLLMTKNNEIKSLIYKYANE